DREIHPALVWRKSGRLDHLHAFLPTGAVGRLRLCPPQRAIAQAPPAGRAPSRFAPGRVVVSTDYPGGSVEAAFSRRSGLPYFAVVIRLRGPALLCALHHWPAHAGMVSPAQ